MWLALEVRGDIDGSTVLILLLCLHNLSFAVWSMLAGMAAGGRVVGDFWVIDIIQRPVVLHFFTTYDCLSLVCDVTTNHGEFYCAARIAKFGERQ